MTDDLTQATWVTLHSQKPTELRIRRCRLSVVSGPDAPLSQEFDTDRIRIGASKVCDLVLSDRRVSGAHLELRLEPVGYRLVDLESTNGTWVEGARVNDAFISPGAAIRLGGSTLRFEPLPDSTEVPLAQANRFGRLVGQSPSMRQLFAKLERIAVATPPVLIVGETGTGKDLVVEALHEHSARAQGPLVVFDCASAASSLIEAELYGYERGAFTGAEQAQAGAFEKAEGGTLFIDEVAELPLELQPRLLRALEQGEVRRLGGARAIQVNARVIATTKRDLAIEVNRGRFREDLYYRLAVLTVRVPSLRERVEDIPLLVEAILSERPGPKVSSPGHEALKLLQAHRWPGNVRELKNVVERAVAMSVPPIPEQAGANSPAEAPGLASFADPGIPFREAKQSLIDAFERQYLLKLLEQTGGNITAAARNAGVDRMSLHRMLQRLQLPSPNPRKGER